MPFILALIEEVLPHRGPWGRRKRPIGWCKVEGDHWHCSGVIVHSGRSRWSSNRLEGVDVSLVRRLTLPLGIRPLLLLQHHKHTVRSLYPLPQPRDTTYTNNFPSTDHLGVQTIHMRPRMYRFKPPTTTHRPSPVPHGHAHMPMHRLPSTAYEPPRNSSKPRLNTFLQPHAHYPLPTHETSLPLCGVPNSFCTRFVCGFLPLPRE